MADASDVVFGAGRDTARVALDPASEEARLTRSRRARGNLAAILVEAAGGLDVVAADGTLVAEEFRELCDLLGLDPPPSADPGVCRRSGCCNLLSLSGVVRPGSGSGNARSERGDARRKGFCSNRCMRISYLPARDGG
jgi:hypothetical protein